MTIQELEQHIKESGSLMATALMQFELTGCFADRGKADAYRLRMEQAIAERLAAEKTYK
ncbi:MAG: hypothetical protein ACK5A0_11090 [Polaromonas sp.]|jgi:ABC-type uncharacterized transport system auxiliary subunit